jgi:16S rRNA (uracil1498-N3)-methyltransferase
VRLADGAGRHGWGTIVRLSSESALVELTEVRRVAEAPPVHLLVPVSDRERMLLLAEKAAELEATSWRPVLWHRSRSVKPRGEGPTFAARVRARMASALEQSGVATLPMIYPEATPERAVAAAPDGLRVYLDANGPPLLGRLFSPAVTVAVGPEGGLNDAETELLRAGGFVPASLGRAILRFETAAMAALAIVRAALLAQSPADGH